MSPPASAGKLGIDDDEDDDERGAKPPTLLDPPKCTTTTSAQPSSSARSFSRLSTAATHPTSQFRGGASHPVAAGAPPSQGLVAISVRSTSPPRSRPASICTSSIGSSMLTPNYDRSHPSRLRESGNELALAASAPLPADTAFCRDERASTALDVVSGRDAGGPDVVIRAGGALGDRGLAAKTPLVSSISRDLKPPPLNLNLFRLQVEEEGMPEINIVVLGASGVGKSTFVQRALGLRLNLSTRIATRKLSIDGAVYSLRLLEIDAEDLVLDKDQQILWPDEIEGIDFPQIDGALCLYDVLEQRSIKLVIPLLAALVLGGLPPVLVCCKSDLAPGLPQVDTTALERARTLLGDLDAYETSANVPESQKVCIRAVVRTAITNKDVDSQPDKSPRRQRANSTSPNEPATGPTSLSKHNRAISEYAAPSLMPSSPRSPTKNLKERPEARGTGSRTSYATAKSAQSPSTTEHPRLRRSPSYGSSSGQSVDSSLGDSATRNFLFLSRSANATDVSPKSQAPTSAPNKGTHAPPSGHDGSILPGPSQHHNSQRLWLAESEDQARADFRNQYPGFTLTELVNRLIAQPVNKSDANFAPIFLCLYRKFAAPQDFLDTMLNYFSFLDERESQPMIRLSLQLRHLSIMSQWVLMYPGDFALPPIRSRLKRFVANISNRRAFAVAAKEMKAQLDIPVEDNDDSWGASDKDQERPSTPDSSLSNPSIRSTSSTLLVDSSVDDLSKAVRRIDFEDGTRSPSSLPSRGDSAINTSPGSIQNILNTVESAQRQAILLEPAARKPITKIQWRQLMEMPEEDVAKEMTRIDWIMYSSIRPRDLVRHVSLPSHLKEGCKSLGHVNRMINHFNHVAYWVANMVLLRDKPKHRMNALEKFMGIAKKLRQMNNYNSLGAVVAGINGNSVHRLTQTRELVSHQIQKEFMGLEILMGTQKSHFAYRLAWANTTSGRIPFLPLHRRDLVSAEEGNRTFLGDKDRRINWKKFEIMGEVIVEVQKSQGTPYPAIEPNLEAQKLLLNLDIVKDDEELYERSIQLESPGYVDKKKFTWFQR
ncbi:MAG: hypothetical protein M1837_005492 [Sclerophora amabilis]|nr:MAG: hypothetical protein M1837_005492 [Sclerophora amabilis]